MNRLPIKVGFCVAYDWYFLKTALPLIYDSADEICLSIDKDCISWSGASFAFDEENFSHFISLVDKEKKIRLYKDDFHKPDLTPMQNEVRQRNMMAERMGKGGWHIQLDADEYFVDFGEFVKRLHHYRGSNKVNICVPWVTLFKRLSDSWLVINMENTKAIEYIPVATLNPSYEYGRTNGYFNHKINTLLLHQSWARSKEEIEMKVKNWGHKNDFNAGSFIMFWDDLSKENYKSKLNFHPLKPFTWASLKEVPGKNIEDVINFLKQNPPALLNAAELKKQNSIIRSRVKAVLKRMGLVK